MSFLTAGKETRPKVIPYPRGDAFRGGGRALPFLKTDTDAFCQFGRRDNVGVQVSVYFCSDKCLENSNNGHLADAKVLLGNFGLPPFLPTAISN